VGGSRQRQRQQQRLHPQQRAADADGGLEPGAAGEVLSAAGVRILLAAGVYAATDLPAYMESRYGTAVTPVIIQAADGEGTAVLQGA